MVDCLLVGVKNTVTLKVMIIKKAKIIEDGLGL